MIIVLLGAKIKIDSSNNFLKLKKTGFFKYLIKITYEQQEKTIYGSAYFGRNYNKGN